MERLAKNIHSNNINAFRSLFFRNVIGASDNSARVGVIFEGGALRGVVSCGYGMALRPYLMPHCLSCLYGTSSGALNSIYYLTDELSTALTIYSENATDKRCTNVLRFPDVLDVDWLIDNWIFGEKRFNLSRASHNVCSANIIVTALRDGRPYYFNALALDDRRLNQVMKATAYAPLLTRQVQVIDGVAYGDGAVTDALPYQRAIADGCTHIICLLTRPPEYRKGRGSMLMHALKALRLRSHTAAYRSAYWNGEANYNRAMEALYSPQDSLPPTLIISPSDRSDYPGNIETDPTRVRDFGLHSYESAKSQLEALFPNDTPA